MRNFFNRYVKKTISGLLVTAFLLLTFYFLDLDAMLTEVKVLASRPMTLLLIFVCYFLSFLARSIAWKLYLKNKASLATCMYGLFYSLLLNHLLPVKAGDLARIGILKAREPKIPSQEAFTSVIVLRLLDTAILFSMAIIGLAYLDLPINGWFLLWIAAAAAIGFVIAFVRFRQFIIKHVNIMLTAFYGWHGVLIAGLTLIGWILEAVVIYGVILTGGSTFSFVQAVWVNSITVAGQIFQITPGGLASYEAVMVIALGATGIAGEKAYSAAIMTHGLKYIFAFVVGGAALAAYPVPIRLIKKWTRERGNES